MTDALPCRECGPAIIADPEDPFTATLTGDAVITGAPVVGVGPVTLALPDDLFVASLAGDAAIEPEALPTTVPCKGCCAPIIALPDDPYASTLTGDPTYPYFIICPPEQNCYMDSGGKATQAGTMFVDCCGDVLSASYQVGDNLSNIAANLINQCLESQGPTCLAEPTSQNPSTPGGLLFFSPAMDGVAYCPDGSPSLSHVPAAMFVDRSQEGATKAALSYANRSAIAHRVCLSGLSLDELSIYVPVAIGITATGAGVSASGNSWSASGLPPGLTLSGTGPTALISGIPTAEGPFYFTLQIRTPNGDSQAKAFYLCVVAITPDVLPTASYGIAYIQALSATGCARTPLYWQITDGWLPDGIAIDPDTGVISGTPIQGGEFDFKVMASDNIGNVFTKDYAMLVERIQLTCDASALYYPGSPASYTVVATGNLYPVTFTWNCTATWLHLDAATGVMSGTPDPTYGNGPYVVTFSVLATDQTTGATAVLPINLRCHALPSFGFTTTSLAEYTPSADYSDTVATTLGVGSAMIYADGLPAGLLLDWATGDISGTAPAGDTSYSILLTAVELGGDQRTIHTTLNLLRVFAWQTTQDDLDESPYENGVAFGYQFATTITGAIFTATGLPAWSNGITTAGLLVGLPGDVGATLLASHYSIRVTASVFGRADICQDFTIYELFEWATAEIPDYNMGSGYVATIEQTISHDAVAFSFVSGLLPFGYNITSRKRQIPPDPAPSLFAGDYIGRLAFTVPDFTLVDSYIFTLRATCGTRTIEREFTTSRALKFSTTVLPLPAGPDFTSYSYQITMTGAIGALTFTGTGLPDGMAVSSSGLVTGPSPAIRGFHCHVEEFGGRVVDADFTYTPLVPFGWDTAADGGLDRYTAGAAYAVQVHAHPIGVVFSMVTDPTGWLSISPDGWLSGTVPSDVADSITGLVLQISDIYGRTDQRVFSMTMADIADLILTTTQGQIPKFTDGTSQLVTFFQTGAIGTPTWTVTSDTLGVAAGANPGEFILTPDNTLDDYTFHVELSDERARTVNQDFHMWRTLAWPTPPQTVTPFVKGVAYTFQIETTWSHTHPTIYETPGTLPEGLSMSSAGLVTGTPTGTDASYSVPVTAQAGNQTITTTLVFPSLNFAFTTTDDSTPTGIPNFNPYETAFPSTFRFATTIAYVPNSENNPRFSVAATTPMPKGLTLELGGTITGQAAIDSDVAYSVAVTATYSVGGVQYSITKTFTMRRAILFITTQADLDAGRFYTPGTAYYEFYFTTLRIGSPVQATLSATGLPAWLSMNSAGIITGTCPTQSGSLPSHYTFSVTITEVGGANRTLTQSFTIYQTLAEAGFQNVPPWAGGLIYPGNTFNYYVLWKGYQSSVTLTTSALAGYYIPAWMSRTFTPGDDRIHVFGTRPNPDTGPTNWGCTTTAVESGAPHRTVSVNDVGGNG